MAAIQGAPICTPEDYEAMFGECEDTRLPATLEYACALVEAECVNGGVDVSTILDRARLVVLTITNRAMGEANSDTPYGATQYSQAVTGVSYSFTLANPYRRVMLKDEDLTLLGLGGGRAAWAGIGGAT